MGYKGRVLLTCISLVVGIPYVIYNSITLQSIGRFAIDMVVLIMVTIAVYSLGKQYDKSKSLHKDLEENQMKLANHYKELLETQTDLRMIMDNVDALIWSSDLQNNKIVVSKGIEKLFGYKAEEYVKNEKLCLDATHPDDKEMAIHYYQQLTAGDAGMHEWRIICADGQVKWIHCRGSAIFDETGKAVKLIGVLLDITDRKQAEKKLKISEKRYRTLFESANDIIILFELSQCGFPTKIVAVNKKATEKLGYTSDELQSLSPIKLIPQENHNEIPEQMKMLLKKRTMTYDGHLKRKDGKKLLFEFNASMIDSDEKTLVISIARDIYKRKKTEDKLTQMAYFDELTSLPNRIMLYDFLEEALELIKEHSDALGLGILFVDLDGFKEVNDTMGHDIGDSLLKKVGERLTACVRDEDIVSRLGGDEFIIVLNNSNKDTTALVANRIIAEVSKPYNINGKVAKITPSIGISLSPENGDDVEQLIQRADKAMYHAKNEGKSTFKFYESALENVDPKKFFIFDKISKFFKK